MVRLSSLLIAAAVLAACAPVTEVVRVEKGVEKPLVFPAPPDEPRFVFERTLRGSADVQKPTSATTLERLAGREGDESIPLVKPYAVAARLGRVYVSDSANRDVKVFDIRAGRYTTIGSDGPEPIIKPLGLDVSNDGRVFVADATDRSVKIFASDGKFIKKIGKREQFDRLSSVTVDGDGKRIYVVDIGGVSSQNHRVRVFDVETGNHLFDIGKRGVGLGEFNLPRDLAIGKDGKIYVVDGGNFRIQVFDKDGKYLNTFGKIGRQWGNFARPKEVATDKDGNVYVVDAAFGNFQIFNEEGDVLLFVGNRSEEDRPANYMLPSGIALDEDGRVYMVDQWFRKIDIYRPFALKENEGLAVAPEKRPAAGAVTAGAAATSATPAPK
jgi:DNA-binding beta-propeller fold protein YncE